jgi:hypothetical protein
LRLYHGARPVPAVFAGYADFTHIFLLNFANVIALPLLLGIGVAFNIYFVMNWRAGRHNPLQSSTARAVVFSAFTTLTAFSSLAFSPHAGTASMGRLLTICLLYTLASALILVPALLGTPEGYEREH